MSSRPAKKCTRSANAVLYIAAHTRVHVHHETNLSQRFHVPRLLLLQLRETIAQQPLAALFHHYGEGQGVASARQPGNCTTGKTHHDKVRGLC